MKVSINKVKVSQLLIGLSISGIFMWLALRNVSLPRFSQALRQADYQWVALAIFFQILAVITRAERWRRLLADRVTRSESFWALGIGYLFTNVLPFRLGEPARVAVMSSRNRLSFTQVATTAVLERLLDLATILLLLIGILPLMNVPSGVLKGAMFFGVIVIVSLGIILAISRLGARSERLFSKWFERIIPNQAKKVTVYWRQFLLGLAGLKKETAASAVIWSFATWVCSIGVYWCVLRAFQPLAKPIEAVFMVIALSLALTVPSGPGFIGVFQWVGQQALVLPFGDVYESGSALAITMTAHLVYYLFTSLLGVIGLWQFGQSFINARRIINTKQPAPHDQSAVTRG